MRRAGKPKARLRARPCGLSWEEATRLLRLLGYEEVRGQGSRRKFRGEGAPAIGRAFPGD